MAIDELMTQFRLASRELFNHYYRVEDPYNNDGWALERRFAQVQELLFQTLVVQPGKLPPVEYGGVTTILVGLGSEFAPIMLNRAVDSGYWDHPIREVTRDAQMVFVCFFDWDQLDVRDNRYVRVLVQAWPSKSEAIGKHALIESQYVRFIDA